MFNGKLKLRKVATFVSCLTGLIICWGCEKEDPASKLPPVDSEGLTEEIRNVIPDEVLNKAKDLGFVWNGGNTPPNIEGGYFATPVVLVGSTNGTDNIGGKFNDGTFIFSDQNSLELTIGTYIEEMGVDSDEAVGSFITGKDNGFSVFVVMNMYSQTVYFFISGKIETGGIRDLHFLLMSDNLSRLFKDEDGLAERMIDTKSAIQRTNRISSETLETFWKD